jgi:putative spermidine/putrescine transport system permease protein
MTTADATATADPGPGGPGRRLSTFLFHHPRARLWLLLGPPLAWLILVYFGSLVVLLLSAFWDTDSFTGEVVHSFTLDNLREIVETPVYRDVALRTITMAAAVTVACAVLAFPIAYYMARIASPRVRNLLVIAVLMPLWANYLVKAYAWRTILSDGGIVNWAIGPFGIVFDGFSTVGLWLVFTYLWLPFMILPVYAGLERIPTSLLEASSDLGGRSFTTFRRVILPLAFPAVVAGSIFTFSLTLGDYIAPGLITSEQFIGTVIYNIRSQALPTAAAFSLVPIGVVVAYLLVARKLKAFESL